MKSTSKPFYHHVLSLVVSLATCSAGTALADRIDTGSPSRTRGSTNYEAIRKNDDGSVSIIKPKYRAPNGQNLRLMATGSSLDGVCKLYGFVSYVRNSLLSHDDSNSVGVKINASGRFGGYLDNRTEVGHLIDSLACSTGSEPGGNPGARTIRNDDGSVSIMAPTFRLNGTSYRLMSNGSSMDGICRLFGLPGYVPNSAITHDDNQTVGVLINSASQFAGYRYSGTEAGLQIDAMSCFSDERHSASDRARRIRQNDDGSVSIQGPMFRINGKDMPIMEEGSDLNGVCRLYGFEEFIPESLESVDDNTAIGVGINRNGTFATYVNSGFEAGHQIRSMMCI